MESSTVKSYTDWYVRVYNAKEHAHYALHA